MLASLTLIYFVVAALQPLSHLFVIMLLTTELQIYSDEFENVATGQQTYKVGNDITQGCDIVVTALKK